MSRPFIPAPKTAQVEFICQYGALFAENVFHIESDHNFTAADFTTLAPILKTDWGSMIGSSTSSSWGLSRIRLKALHASDAPILDYVTGLPIMGTIAQVPAPPNVTFCVSGRTGLAGRSARARWYFIGLGATDAQGNGVLSTVRANTIVTQLNNFNYDLDWNPSIPFPCYMVVTSFATGKAWRAEAVNYRITSWVAVDNNLDSQRRRLVGRGRT